jgi:hypothetical protein
MALANSDGGFLVIGANEKDNGGFDLVGVDDDQAATWETTRLGNKVRVYAEPPVSLRVRVVECQASRYIVITVDGFQRVPHICKKEYHTKESGRILSAPTFYIRTVTCESRPVQSADELNELIVRAVETRQDQMLTAIRSALLGSSTPTQEGDRAAFDRQIADALEEAAEPLPGKPYDAFYADLAFPARFQEDRFTRAELQQALSVASVLYEGGPFLDYKDGDQHLTTMEDGFRFKYVSNEEQGVYNNTDRYFYWRLRRSSLLVVKSLAWEDVYFGSRTQRRINKRSIVAHIAEAIDAIVRLYSELGVTDEDVTWMFQLSGVRDRHLADAAQIAPYPGQNPTTDQETVGVRRTMSIESWRAGQVDHTVEAIRDIFEQFNARFVNYGDIRMQVQKLLRMS